MPSENVQTFAKGEILIRENEISRKMFVITSGKVRVTKAYMNQKITLAILGEGEIFGEMSFVDGQPRSATIEALTPVECFVLDSAEAEQQFKGLPEWLMPIVRTVFSRLRSADTRTTVLASMNEIEKRHFKRDSVAEDLYRELLRLNRVFLLVYERSGTTGGKPQAKNVLRELDEVLGDHTLNLQTYWKLLCECDFLDEAESGDLTLQRVNFDKWTEELKSEIAAQTYTLLSHTSVALLRRIIGHLHADDESYSGTPKVKVLHSELNLEHMPLADEALAEMAKREIIHRIDNETIEVDVPKAFNAFMYQSLLKYFEHRVHGI